MFNFPNSLTAYRLIASVALLLALPAAVQAQDFDCTTNDDNTITIAAYLGSDAEVVIPGMIGGLWVTRIGDSAFDSSGVTGVTIPDSVTNLGDYAFSSCGLTSVSLPTNLTSTGIYVFDFCTSLTNVTLPGSVTNIGNGAFSGCISLEGITIPGSVTAIGDGAFSGSGLAAVALPDGLATIGDSAFYSCTSLTNAIIGSGVTNIGDYAFSDCASLAAVAIPAGVTRIGAGAFSACASLTGVILPDSLANVGDWMFSHCVNLAGITIGNSVTNIGSRAFDSCTNMTGVTIGNSVTHIGNFAFHSCAHLDSIIIPGSVTNLGDSVFASCNSLTGVYFLGDAPTPGDSMFAGASNVTVYYLSTASGWVDTFGGRTTALWTPQPQVSFNHTINNSTVTITGYTGSLDVVAIPRLIDGLSVTRIGDSAFYSCTNLTGITIPGSVTNIGSRAFDSCTRLTSINIPGSVTRIGFEAFIRCTRLDTIMVDASNAFYSSVDGVLFNTNQATLIQCPEGKAGSYAIPGTVTAIAGNAFYSCTNLTSVTMGANVTTIGAEAFYQCIRLPGITIPAGVTNIGERAFYSCTSLTGITVNAGNASYSSVDGVLFNYGRTTLIQCPAVKAGSYTLPASVTNIGEEAFAGTLLAGVTIPAGVTSIGVGAFYSCTSLTGITVNASNAFYRSVDGVLFDYGQTTLIQFPGGKDGGYAIPASVTSIGNRAFFQCASLTDVAIPVSVTSIGEYMFDSCTNLGSVTIGSNVTSLADHAFYNCTSLAGVYFRGDVPPVVGSSVFDGDDFATIYYLTGAAGWVETLGVFDGRPVELFPYQYTANAGAITITGYTGSAGVLAIPDTIDGLPVTLIGDNAFDSCTSLTNVMIPGSVTNIGGSAFYNCTRLARVTIPGSVTSVSGYAFYGCTNLARITIPAGVGSIGERAFYHCTSLTNVTIPAGVTSIGDRAFNSCSNLAAITVNASNAFYSSVDGVLFNANQATLIQCPGGKAGSYTVPNSVTNLAEWAFSGCTLLAGVTIPAGVSSIGSYAFSGCTRLADVYFLGKPPGLGSSVFAGAGIATVYYLPGPVITGWVSPFGGRPAVLLPYYYTTQGGAIALTGYAGSNGVVAIPGTINGLPVTRIGDNTFSNCTSLTGITIPASVTNIGNEAFYHCTRLAGITVDASNTFYIAVDGVLFDMSLDTLIQYPAVKPGSDYTIPASVTNIGVCAFYCCTNLGAITVNALNSSYRSVDGVLFDMGLTTLIQCPGGRAGSYAIPAGVTNIGGSAFEYCIGLASVTVPGSVVHIGDNGFAYCSGLASVYFLGNAPAPGASVFDGANSATVYALASAKDWEETFGGRPVVRIVYNFTSGNGAVTITAYIGSGGEVDIPGQIDGVPVTGIGSNAFYACTNVTGVVIPASVTNIGDYAFFGCTGLTNVMIGANVARIGIGAFAGCTRLAGITVDAGNAFYSSLDGVLFNKGWTTLIQYPAGKAGRYTLPAGVTRIGDYAFYGCAGLAGLYFPGNAPGLGVSVFDGAGNAVFYCLPGTTGWGGPFGGRTAVPWDPQVGAAGFGVRTNQFGFAITGASNMVVVVEACTSLVNHAWSPLQTNSLGGGSLYFSDSQWTNHPGRFYNLRMP